MKKFNRRQQLLALGVFALLCAIEAMVAVYGVQGALSYMPALLAAFDYVQHAVPVAQRFTECGGAGGTTGALIAASAIFLPIKALTLFVAFPFTLEDTERLWSGSRDGYSSLSRRLFCYARRGLLLGLCVVPAMFVFIGFADDIDTGQALRVTHTRYRQFCEGGPGVYPNWLMYAMFATVPCMVFFAAGRSLWNVIVSALNFKNSTVQG